MADADRSSIEIKVLLKNLDPTKASIKHKDRLRRLNKFRNYVTAQPPPEFYDDDYSLLLLGSEAPSAMEDEDLSRMTLYGLLRAAGCPSTDHKDSLKRSARPTIALLRYLCLEFEATVAPGGGDGSHLLGELNGFAAALCALSVPQLRALRLATHIGKGDNEGGNRGGSKDDACHLLALILARHTDADYETPAPLQVQAFLPEARSQAEFETWLGEAVGPDVRKALKENMVLAEGGKLEVGFGGGKQAAANSTGGDNPFADDDDDGDDDGDVLGVFGKRDAPQKGGGGKAQNKRSDRADAAPRDPDGKPTRWSETQMASEKERALGAIFLEEEREKALAEKKKAEEEKQKIFGRDPLGIHSVDGFDLQTIDNNREVFIQQLLHEIEQIIELELGRADQAGVEKINWLEAQKQALLKIVEDSKKKAANAWEGEESKNAQDLPSILPTDPGFDPLLFLTLVHRDATYKELQDSTSRLSRKTDNQVERLQNLVRENFGLFIRCSEGIDIFANHGSTDTSGKANSDYSSNKDQLSDRFQKLDAIAESCSEQARRSFKPLLDNTNEVRKVQSALSVLQRVAPLLQVPSLMRQYIEKASFSSVVKAYRKVLVIDKNHCDVDLLHHVRTKADEAAQDARIDLELILADETSSGQSLLDAIRDLGELLELLEEEEGKGGSSTDKSTPRSSGQASNTLKPGTFSIDGHKMCARDYPPALACLLLQTTHFRSLVNKAIASTQANVERVFPGEGPDNSSYQSTSGGNASSVTSAEASSQRSRDKRWKFEVLEARVGATKSAVALAKNWLPRLLQIGVATQEAEKRRVARQRRRKMPPKSATASFRGLSPDETNKHAESKSTNIMSAKDIFSVMKPALTRLVEHIAFTSLGCANQGFDCKVSATFGKGSPERIRVVLRSPLPPSQTSKVAPDLAELAEALQSSQEVMLTIKSLGDDGEGTKSEHELPLEKALQLTNSALVMIEQRVCIYSFDACARKCYIGASGSGIFDGDSLLQCVQKLSDDLTRSDECSKEIEKGLVLFSQKSCEGLAVYVKDRSDAARLRVVAECANALNTTIVDVVREVSYLTNNAHSESLESNLSSVISAMEKEMFGVFLESVKRNVSSSARLGSIETSENGPKNKKSEDLAPFPAYLAASFLTIVRCRAQVERALPTYKKHQFLALQTACDGVVENICLELKSKLNIVRSQADILSIHLQFLMNTLKKYLSNEILSLASDTRRMLLSASTGGKGVGKGMGNGPEGLAALENLERLGRVWVMCLGE